MRTATTSASVDSRPDRVHPADLPSFDSIRHRAGRAREAIADSIDDRLRSVRRAAARGRHAAEDASDMVRLRVRRDPLRVVGLALAIGALSGVAIGRLTRLSHRRRFW